MDVSNAVDAGLVAMEDLKQLEHATAEGRVLYTYNVGDFHSLHARLLADGKDHAGIILAPQQRYTVGEQMRRVLRMNRELSAEQMRNRAEFLSAWG